jgi:hypothetical protein
MALYRIKEKFAWRPILTTSGKWIWWRRYIKLMKFYWGLSGEGPAIDAEFYTEGEWLLESIKNDYTNHRPPPPTPTFKSVRSANTPPTKRKMKPAPPVQY